MKLLEALQGGGRVHYEPVVGGAMVFAFGSEGTIAFGKCDEVKVTEFEHYSLLADFVTMRDAGKLEEVDRIAKGCHRVFHGMVIVYALKKV